MTPDNNTTTKAPIPLEAPVIYVALENGLIPIEYLQRPVTVNFPVWPAAQPGYTYQLRFDGLPASAEKPIQETDKPGDVLQVEIPVHLLKEGSHSVSYRTYSPTTGVEDFSDSTTIQIDRTAPGAPELGPILFPPAIQEGLTSDELTAMHNVLSARIAGYSGMAAGDVIRTYWGRVEGPAVTVGTNDMGLKRVMIDYSRVFLERVGDGREEVYYTVTDLAGNVSMKSEAVSVDLKLSYVAPLPLPIIKEAINDTLDPANTPYGATVIVAASANLGLGDQVRVSWSGPKGSENKDNVIGANDVGKALSVVFSSALVNANRGEEISVSYRIIRKNGSLLFSRYYSVIIQSNGLTLDVSPVTLAGKIYLMLPDQGVYPAFPAGTTVQRVASGGKPPYTYSSSNVNVAHVNAQGLTSVRGKGTANITVTDASGRRLSYPVTVTGVIKVSRLKPNTYQEVVWDAGRNNARLPTMQELREVYTAYGSRWPLEKTNIWASTDARLPKAAVKHFGNGQEGHALTINKNLGVGLHFS